MQRSLTIARQPGAAAAEALPRLVAFVEEVAEHDEWPLDLVMRSNLILEELVLNALTHGRTSGMSQIEVTLETGDRSVTIGIIDDGKEFNPLVDAPTADTGAALEDRPIGGLGLHLVKTMAQDMTYERIDGRNHLSLVVRSGV